jgi:gas vesicle protein
MIQYKGALILGGLIGAGIGILLAPEKGSFTRNNLKREANNVKNKLSEDFVEVKEDLCKATTSGKEKFKEEAKEFTVKASKQTEKVITFLEKQLAILKEKNKSFQTTS